MSKIPKQLPVDLTVNKDKKIVFICHSSYLENGKVFDPCWALTFEFLNHYYSGNYHVLRHSLTDGGETRIYSRGIYGTYSKMPLLGRLPGVLRYVIECIFNFFYLLWFKVCFKDVLVLAVDPLSCFSAILLRRIGVKISILFITPDFARARFNTAILNSIYYFFDKTCTRYCDYNYCCAKSVMDYKKELYGERVVGNRLVHYPNIPAPWLVEKYSGIAKTPNTIIFIGSISQQVDFEAIFNTVGRMADKIPDIRLVVVGDGERLTHLSDYVAKNKIHNISFKGLMSYDETLREIASAEVGIALYNGNLSYDEFRDSLKIREYQALKVIPITTPVVKENVKEIQEYKNGVIIGEDLADLESVLLKIFSDAGYKELLRANCGRTFEMYKDKYERLFNRINTL